MARYRFRISFIKIPLSGSFAGIKIPCSFRVCSLERARQDETALLARADVFSVQITPI